MTTDSKYADFGKSRYHKKRPIKKHGNLCSSMADDCATTEDEEEGIIITDEDVMSPLKSTANLITLVGTDGIAPRRPKGLNVPSANLVKNNFADGLISRPYLRRTMTFQSFHLPTKSKRDIGTRSAKLYVKKTHQLQREVPRRNRNALRKLPLKQMKSDLKRKLHKLERKLSRIKKEEKVLENISSDNRNPPTPPHIKTPPHITDDVPQTFGKSRSAIVRSSSTGRKQYTSRESISKISEGSENSQQFELELSARRKIWTRSLSIKSSLKSPFQTLPLLIDEGPDVVPRRQSGEEPKSGSSTVDAPANPQSVQSKKSNASQPTGKPAKKKSKKKKPKKQKADLKGFKQEIPIEGMNYKMEIVLDPELIEKTRAGHIDYRKEPRFPVKPTKTTDFRDEFSAYCGQRTGIKNWLFQV